MATPKTATLRLEIVNDDGSKTIVTTEELDASKLPALGAREDSAERIIIGMVDPHYDPDDYYQRRDRWIGEKLVVPPIQTHFNLNLQLPAVKKGATVCTIQHVEAPLTRVIAYYNQSLKRVQITNYTEGGMSDIGETAAIFKDSIYFFLDIP